MKKLIHLNLKRFDVSDQFGGVNHNLNITDWGAAIVGEIDTFVNNTATENEIDFAVYFPEAHIISAKKMISLESRLGIGCQSVYRQDVSPGGNFGAFTSHRPASAMRQLGVTHTIIGHYEERLDKIELLAKAEVRDFSSVNEILNQEIKMAQQQEMKVLYCIGESLEQKSHWKDVLYEQLTIGLKGVELEGIAIAYEPIWAIGPGKIPPTGEQIKEIADYVKTILPNTPLLYGGGLKKENAKEIASIDSLNGGLIALTRFSGDIGFYSEEFKEIVEEYIGIKNEVVV